MDHSHPPSAYSYSLKRSKSRMVDIELGETMNTMPDDSSNLGASAADLVLAQASIEALTKDLPFPTSTCISTLRHYPSLVVIPLFMFIALCSSGIALTITQAQTIENEIRQDAQSLAVETGQWFSNQLDQAIMPLFSLAQFVSELDIFANLPDAIGSANEPGSLAFIRKENPDEPVTHRNITGVCDDPTLTQRFADIASTIKKNAKMDGILVNLQLAPQAVVCLLHPLINTEDFPEGIVMDNTGAVGHDLLSDPQRSFIAEATLPADDVVVAGPLSLRQCEGCDPTVEKAFIARLPIVQSRFQDHKHMITLANGEAYERWGFAVALINWKALIDRSNIYQTFRENNLEFRLTRTDRAGSPDSYTETIVVLAETEGYDPTTKNEFNSVSTDLQTTNNMWKMTVAYLEDPSPPWKEVAIVVTVIISLIMSYMCYVILKQNHNHGIYVAQQQQLLLDNARNAAQSERELNDFLAHEVRNPLSAAISACTFVSATVNDNKTMDFPMQDDHSSGSSREHAPLILDGTSCKSVREDLTIIETSLRFINELLRSMLDIHRVQSHQLKLDSRPTDVLTDILEPVASMLYRRDENFKLLIECPEHLIVKVDKLRLQQIVLNLTRNAQKFVEQGFVRLRAEVKQDDLSNEVCLYIEDSGPGIPAEKTHNLFGKFQDSLDTLNQGTGVGLSLCKSLIEAMEGDIYLDQSFHSGVEGCPGTRIVVNLKQSPHVGPSSTGRPTSDHFDACSTEFNGSGDVKVVMTVNGSVMDISRDDFQFPEQLFILLVEDDRILRKMMVRSLSKMMPSWTVREAASGESALQMVDEGEHFDLIFMDQYMTSAERSLKGTETTRALRANGIDAIICGLSANDLEVQFLKAGANAFLLKPFPCKQVELQRTLVEILQKGS